MTEQCKRLKKQSIWYKVFSGQQKWEQRSLDTQSPFCFYNWKLDNVPKREGWKII